MTDLVGGSAESRQGHGSASEPGLLIGLGVGIYAVDYS